MGQKVHGSKALLSLASGKRRFVLMLLNIAHKRKKNDGKSLVLVMPNTYT